MSGAESVSWSAVSWVLVACGVAFAAFPWVFAELFVRSALWRRRTLDLPPAQHALAEGRVRRARLLTTISLLALAALLFLPEQTQTGAFAGISFGAFHLVWWFAVFPLLQVGDRARRSAGAATGGASGDGSSGDGSSVGRAPAGQIPAVRTATLTVREETTYLPLWIWGVPLAQFAVAATLTTRRILAGPELSSVALWMGVGFGAGALAFLIGYGCWARHTANAPQDLTGAVDARALAATIDAHRTFVARGVFVLMNLAMAAFLASAVGAVLTDGDPSAQASLGGWLGGLGGSFVGICGGVFGTLCSIRAARVEEVRTGVGAPGLASLGR